MRNLFTDLEIKVAEVLLELSISVSDTEAAAAAARSYTLSWSMRKPRSLRQRKSSSPSSPAVSSVFRLLSPTPPPSLSTPSDAALTPAAAADATTATIKAEVNHKRLSSKKRKDRLLETIDELTRDNMCLKMEIEKAYQCVLEQKAANLQLKSRIHNNYVGFGRKILRSSTGDDYVDGRGQPDTSRVNLEPLVAYQTVRRGMMSTGSSYVYPYLRSNGSDVAGEEPLDMSVGRSMAFSIARQKRKEIRRSKNSHSSSSHKLIFAGR